jgi:hypothetical protein
MRAYVAEGLDLSNQGLPLLVGDYPVSQLVLYKKVFGSTASLPADGHTCIGRTACCSGSMRRRPVGLTWVLSEATQTCINIYLFT